MDVLEQHQKLVRNLREQIERLLSLHARIFNSQRESWALRADYVPETEQQINALHENIDNMNQEIELIREAFFGNLDRSAVHARPTHALVRDKAPATDPAVSAAQEAAGPSADDAGAPADLPAAD